MKLPISLVIITLNEEDNIARCIASVPFASEILVLDSGSHDRTREIAETLGAKFYSETWRGFGPQKHRAVELAQNDWVLCLDADEAISPQLSSEIFSKFNLLDPMTGYMTPRKSWYLGRWIMHGGWYPDYQLRLFNRKHSQWNQISIHEKVEAPKNQKLAEPIQHYVFKSIFQHISTNNRYSTLQANEHFKQKSKFSYFKFLFKPVSKFIECYFLKFGFLDGLPGFFIAVGAAYSVFLRWAKVWEKESGV